MKTTRILHIISILTIALALNSFQTQQDYKVLFEKAVYTMETKADLKGAIDLFETLIKKYPNEKEYVAKSLLYQGLCYERLGNREAVKKYERLVKNFPEQKNEVAYAKDRLTKLLPQAKKEFDYVLAPKFTKINIPTELSWTVKLSPDGQNLLQVADKKLWAIPLEGNLGPGFSGPPKQINTEGTEAEWSGLIWSYDGEWIAFNEFPETTDSIVSEWISVVSSDGGKPKKIFKPFRGPRVVNYQMSISPDDKQLAFSTIKEDKQYIYSIPTNGGNPKKLTEMEAREPVFSPDGKMIAFTADRGIGRGKGDLGLWVVPSSGGTPHQVANAIKATSPIWSPDGDMIAYIDEEESRFFIVRLNPAGEAIGDPVPVDAPEGTAFVKILAGWTTDNKIGALLVMEQESAIYTLPVQGGQAAMIQHTPNAFISMPRWSPDGKQIYYSAPPEEVNSEGFPSSWKILASVPASGGKGKPVSGDWYKKNIRLFHFGGGNRVSPDGKSMVAGAWTPDDVSSEYSYPMSRIWKLSLDGKESTQITKTKGPFFDADACWSPDGTQIAFIRHKLVKPNDWIDHYIYIVDSSGGKPEPLDSITGKKFSALIWSPDGKMLACLARQTESPFTSYIYVLSINKKEARLHEIKNDVYFAHTELAWSPDSKKIAFNYNDDEKSGIKVMTLSDGSFKEIKTGLTDLDNIVHFNWSPDGKKFVFVGWENGKKEFYWVEDFLSLGEMAEQHLKKGNELYGLWEYNQAIEEYKKAMEPDPKSLVALNAQYGIGQSLFRLGKYDLSLETFKKLVKDNPESNIAPVTELMISQVEYVMVNEKRPVNTSSFINENTIVSEQGITFNKIKALTGKSDIVTYTVDLNLSPNGKYLLFGNMVVPMDGTTPFELIDFKSTKLHVTRGTWSPDGTMAAFFSGEALCVVPVSQKTGHVTGAYKKINSAELKYQNNPSWSPDSKKLVYQGPEADIWEVNSDASNLKQITKTEIREIGPTYSPDGKTIAFGLAGGNVRLYNIEKDEINKFVETDYRCFPTWSPDGNWIIGNEFGKLHFYNVANEKEFEYSPPEDVGNFFSWSKDGKKMLFFRNSYFSNTGLRVASPEGGPSYEPVPLTTNWWTVRWSGDSKFIAVQGEDEQGEIVIRIVPLTGGKSKMIQLPEPSGNKLFPFNISDNTKILLCSVEVNDEKEDLYAVPISARDAKTAGPAVKIFTKLKEEGPARLSPDGDKLAISYEGNIWIAFTDGRDPVMVVDNPEDIGYVEWTPDGNALLFSTPLDGWNLLIDPFSNGKVIQLLDEGNTVDCSFWDIDISPDNKRFAFSTEKQLKIISLNTLKSIRILDAKDLELIEFGEVKWSPDGENLAFIGIKERTDNPVSTLHERKCQIFNLSMSGGQPIRVAPDDDDWKDGLSWSPDGKWIAYSPMKPVKIRPESTIWEADFEEVKEKLLKIE